MVENRQQTMIEFHAPNRGGMAERFKAPVLKTGMGRKLHRGFESLSLRLQSHHQL
jgi:hypothetical protein